MTGNDFNTQQRLFLGHVATICAGIVTGLVVAYLFAGVRLDFSQEIKRAQDLGIVSKTILMRYGKGRDILNYLALVGLPVLGALGAWLAWTSVGNRRPALAAIFPPPAPPVKDASWRWVLVAAAVGYLFLSFDVNHFYSPSFNSFLDAWPFLGEEGENLAWAQSIMKGGTYGKDFHCLYGPMLIYPLAWFMKLFGASVLTARCYAFCLNLAAYGIVLAFLCRSLRSKTAFLCAAALYIVVFRPGILLAPNESYLRVALGLAAILLANGCREGRNVGRLALTGLVLGQSLLFSQEVAICATLSVLALLAARRRGEPWLTGFGRDAGVVLGAIALSVAPLVSWFAYKGAVKALLDTLLVHPRLLSLGYSSLAFPDFREFLRNPWSDLFFHYWVIFMYIAAAAYLLPLLILGRRDRETLLRSALLLFGALLYRAALARSDVYHVFFASPPAFILAFLFVEDALAGLRASLSPSVVAVRAALAAGVLAGFVALAVNSSCINPVEEAATHIRSIPHKLSVQPGVVPVPSLARAGVLFDPGTAATLKSIGEFLDGHTRPGEGVYFFPNEAAYYFLFDRDNPTRYAMSYFAVTTGQRLELNADLERKRPTYMVFSRNTWRIDNITERVQVPEVCDYLVDKYSVFKDLGDVVIFKRNAT